MHSLNLYQLTSAVKYKVQYFSPCRVKYKVLEVFQWQTSALKVHYVVFGEEIQRQNLNI